MTVSPTPSLWDHLRFQARLRPHALAVHGPAGPVSYAALVRDVAALAKVFAERTLTRADLVGLQLDFSYMHVLAILALDLLGIPSLSLASAEPMPAPATWRDGFGITAMIASRAAPADASVRWIEVPDQHRPRLGEPDGALLARLDSPPDALVRVIWSSGSTGGPKGAPLTRVLQLRRMAARSLARAFGPRTRYFTAMPFSAEPGYVMLLAILANGGAVILPDPATDFVSRANALGVTVTNASPAMLAELLARRGLPRRLDTMELLLVSGAQLAPPLAEEVRVWLTPNLWVAYGSTETASVATADAAIIVTDPTAVGFVFPDVAVEIVDDADRPQPDGREGRVRLRSAQMITGYYKDDDATRRNFRDGWFYPGDLGAITADGLLRITGRIEDLIMRDGVAQSPQPIEEAMRALPGVRDVAVFPWTGPDGATKIAAAVVLEAGTDPASIGAVATARLGAQAPTRLFLIDKLPRNANGKIMRRELVALAERSAREAPRT
ncbi:MAG TPA: class I adenylate-forming enzyme family protein [Candidatus Sulfotelmatobacter sp.]|nr:class I adenylate-forming enzyme family protein [Candidatus Sulfotelmatobacter sp.]